ncbi:MAG: ribosome biogenesis GTP-binding protein YihA/YsxC [Legionellaceae bacterium]|nr:ribosome biogenesis GTP-binding protein YihA/YsxC [Legionellaceae bacterium]
MNFFHQAAFLKSAPSSRFLPPDEGIEVAFVGRSNAGKSTTLNRLTGRTIARTSKTPGCTQMINVFTLDETRRLIDLPGYGFAQVSIKTKQTWQKSMQDYLQERQSLRGIVLIMDCRHPLKPLDIQMLEWASSGQNLRIHVVLSKSDKISRLQLKSTLLQTTSFCQSLSDSISVQTFSGLKKEGIETLVETLLSWYEVVPTIP